MNAARIRSLLSFLGDTEGSVADRALRSGVWVSVSSGVAYLLRFARAVILARLLAPSDFGLMGIVLFFVRGIDVLSQPGLSAAIIQRKDRIREATDVAWAALIGRGFLLAAIIALTAPAMAAFYVEPRLVSLIRVVACVFVIQGFTNTHVILLRREMDFKRVALFEIVSSVLELIVVVTLAVVYRNVWALIAGEVLRMACRVTVSFVIVRDRSRLSFDRKLLTELFRYGKFITGATALTFLGGSLDNAVVGKALDMAQLGFYVMAYGLASMPTTNIAPLITKVMFPAFSKLQGDMPALRRAYSKLVRVVATLTLPSAAGIFVLATPITAVVYGQRWLPMVGALHVLCVFGMLQAFASAARPVFDGIGNPQVNFYLLLLRATLIAVGLYPLTARFGIVGTAIAVTIPALVEQAIQWQVMARVLEVPLGGLLSNLRSAAFATAVMALAVVASGAWVGGMPPLAALIVRVALGVAIFGTVVVATDRRLRGDARDYLRRLFASPR